MSRALPNILTAARLVAVVPFAVLLATADDALSLPAAAVFAVASATDFLDGYLARHARAQSRFGRIFDPIADRLLIDMAIVLLVYHDRIAWWLALPVLLRDVVLTAVFGVRHVAGEVYVNRAGKAATAAIMVSVLLLMSTRAQWPVAVYALGLVLSVGAGGLYYVRLTGGVRSRPS